MFHNFEQFPKKEEDKDKKNKEEEASLMETKQLEDLPPGTVFFVEKDGKVRQGIVVGTITKKGDPGKNIEISWLDVDTGTGVDRMNGKELVKVKEAPKEKPELKETTLGEAKPGQNIYFRDPETGETTKIRIITKVLSGQDIRVLINGEQKILPWNTPVSIGIKKEEEFK